MTTQPTRFSLALDFACAAVAVFFSGRVADGLLHDASADSPLLDPGKSCHPFGGLTSVERSEFLRGGKYYGVYARVARYLNVKPSKVGDVGAGRRGNSRIRAAILAEMGSVDAEIAAREASL